MLLTLGLILIGCIIVFCAAKFSGDGDVILAYTIICTIAITLITIMISATSYKNYIILEQHLANFENHAQTIKQYTKLASNFDNKDVNEITDLKYQSYQNSLKTLIRDFRDYCTVYNKIVVSKKILNNNIVFNWLIIAPNENMEVVKVSDFLD